MYHKKLTALLLPLLLMLFRPGVAPAQVQQDSTTIHKNRLIATGAVFTAGYTAMLLSLNNSWYSKEMISFHFFNDLHAWKQVDKVGHFWGAFHESRAGIDMLRWAGVPKKKAILLGGLTGIILQTPIEVFDGYQPAYGASVGDLVANTVGSAAVVAQELVWSEVRIMPKYSFHTTRYAAVRPNVLGSNLAEQALKDYNGQTYWLSVDVSSFLKTGRKYPGWLNIAVGYGAEEIVFNHEGANRAAGFQAHRQFYMSPDLNLMHFIGHSKFLNTALYVLSIIKIPAPTLEYNTKNGFRMHALYF